MALPWEGQTSFSGPLFPLNLSRLIVGYFAAAGKGREKSGSKGFFGLKNILKDGKKILLNINFLAMVNMI